MEMHVDGGHWHGYSSSGMLSSFATLLFLFSMIVRQSIPAQLKTYLDALATRIHNAMSPYDTISIDERDQVFCWRCNAYLNVEAFLRERCTRRFHCLCATLVNGAARMNLTFDESEKFVDDFNGARIWWHKIKELPLAYGTVVIAKNGWHEEETRAYSLTFHRRHRGLIENDYLPHVLAEGRAVNARNGRRYLYTNKPRRDWLYHYDTWSSVKFEHPSTFATLAMDPSRKQEILDDLNMFRRGKDYYASVGKAWKRGYLLSGPSGTGKSTMIAAIANFLEYDVFLLDLSTIKSNNELRRLFMTTSHKCLIVIEDIDTSVHLSAKREKDKTNNKTTSDARKDEEENRVTLSGLLNFVDGLWSACGGQRIIVLTTNDKENLDPALIRRGRMDLHIEMSYCCFESFKVLAKNYLQVTEHKLFCEIRQLLGEVNMSPADVAENLMPRSKKKDVDGCLGNLVMALKEKGSTGNRE
jgi:hypothetical protein